LISRTKETPERARAQHCKLEAESQSYSRPENKEANFVFNGSSPVSLAFSGMVNELLKIFFCICRHRVRKISCPAT
jgi:hypothetical protein